MRCIGFDIDDVLAEHTRAFITFHNRVYEPKRLRFEQFTTYGIHQVLRVKPEEAYHRLTEFYRSPEFETIVPTFGSQQCLEDVYNLGSKIIVVTGRPTILKDITIDWIEKYFLQVEKNQILFATELRRPGPEQLKGHICHKRGIDVIVEDSLEQALNCAHHAGVVLVDRPWNQTSIALPKDITRAYNFQDVCSTILRY